MAHGREMGCPLGQEQCVAPCYLKECIIWDTIQRVLLSHVQSVACHHCNASWDGLILTILKHPKCSPPVMLLCKNHALYEAISECLVFLHESVASPTLPDPHNDMARYNWGHECIVNWHLGALFVRSVLPHPSQYFVCNGQVTSPRQ